ncbi:BnaA02g30570D [Brassica napus]|uniref:(rape) hypothetical protein n=1 Tax=Brassica napus TaxID=3708 RepID=A0A078H5U1_BRANA|nr:uncharacterized protein LOC106403150 [Brassica napus]CAF2144165.1 unnamed protein product [Brassica napus]CDY33930.1 BnaA02g30570D [Brassica napus]
MVEAKDQDMGDGMQCINHPFTKNPGGICPLCLQEKLGKLVTSSSFPLPKHLSSSSSTSSPSFRSDSVRSSTITTTTASLSLSASNVTDNNSKLPFLLANKKKKMANIVFKRSHSTTAAVAYGGSDLTPRKRNGFWSFLHLHSYKHHTSSKKVGSFRTKHAENTLSETETTTTVRVNGGGSSVGVIVEEDVVTATQSERRVSRSRSVGCGSRSFSGEFFERITHGFGDCTLRRVESHREGNNNNNNKAKVNSSNVGVREYVRCGGIFGGFMIMTPSSSSSSSSSWVSSSSSAEQQHHRGHGGRSRSWGWAFASPMRAFSYSSSGKRGRTISDSTSKNTTPNLDAIPSLLTVRS